MDVGFRGTGTDAACSAHFGPAAASDVVAGTSGCCCSSTPLGLFYFQHSLCLMQGLPNPAKLRLVEGCGLHSLLYTIFQLLLSHPTVLLGGNSPVMGVAEQLRHSHVSKMLLDACGRSCQHGHEECSGLSRRLLFCAWWGIPTAREESPPSLLETPCCVPPPERESSGSGT